MNPSKAKFNEEYEKHFERMLINKNVIHRLKTQDKEIDNLSNSEVVELHGDKQINQLAKELLKDFMYIVNLIYSTALNS